MSAPDPAPSSSDSQTPWWVYMLRCVDGSLYTGATIDVNARIAAHLRGKGARYTRTNAPTALAFCAWMPSKSAALSAEAHIKRWPTAEKRALANAFAAQALVDERE